MSVGQLAPLPFPMNSSSARARALPAPAPTAPLLRHLAALYTLTQSSAHVFASPLGPFVTDGRQAFLPRFVFFGPHASDISWRLCILAGLDPRDDRPARAALALVEHLASDSETAHGLHLSVFPVVDTAALVGGPPDRRLGAEHWGRPTAPEIRLLEGDARARSYHGFIRIETADPGEELAVLALRGAVAATLSPDLELITTEETEPVPVRFEVERAHRPETAGPLSIAEDLPFTPFELTLRLPASWSDLLYRNAALVLLRRFLWRYRAFQSYGQHL
jgi:hypothetical protein